MSAVLAGCSLGYYLQAIDGQLSIMAKRRPVKEVIADPATSPEVRRKLEWVLEVQRFARTELALPESDSYKSYVALDRRYPLWAVNAAPEFSLTPRQWCYPFAGCVPYRGYFSREEAEAFAGTLEKQGYDVAVRGVPAYSTLGWFDDPVYSIMLQWGKVALAGMIIHELAHEKLYVSGDAAFNESFAHTVENVGLERLLSPGDSEALAEFHAWRDASNAMDPYLKEARASLKLIYHSDVEPAQMREEKQAEFAWLATRYRETGAHHGVRYAEGWLDSLNNATIAQANVYDRWTSAFRRLLKCAHGDLPAFYRAAARIGNLPPERRHHRLDTLRLAAQDGRPCLPASGVSGAAPQGHRGR
ncbi:MAG: aminopeptidase [Gammaproteobacteria bacterium]|nr:aminopeptidase [Gammaproteobacteria bacterium]